MQMHAHYSMAKLQHHNFGPTKEFINGSSRKSRKFQWSTAKMK